MEDPIKLADEFASAMQQLSEEAQKSLSENDLSFEDSEEIRQQLARMMYELRALNGRMQNLETVLTKRLEDLTRGLPAAAPFDFAQQFRKLDEEIEAIRISEGLNQRLFDSLHDELIKYRDNFLHESLQKPFIRDLVILFDDLSGLASQLKTTGKVENKRNVGQWRDNLENAIHALVEILHRLEVKEIEAKDKVDRALHRVVSFEPTEFPEEDGQIVMRVKRGFLWRDGVLRPEEVIAKRFN